MQCNICGGRSFIDMSSRKDVKCSKCGSLERTRVMALFIKRDKLVDRDTRIPHIAPEPGLVYHLQKISGKNRTFVDLSPRIYSRPYRIKKFDLCQDLESIDDNSYDLIIHSHVIEHLFCNYTTSFITCIES